jgi:hypothetical protein
MNWKPTWILVGLAAALFAFIVLFERHTGSATLPPPRLISFKPHEVTNIQVRLTNQLLLTVGRARESEPWIMADPVRYPAQPVAIEGLLQALEREVPQTEITPQDLKAGKRSIAEFGLDVPRATLTFQHNGQRTEVMFGARTPVGHAVYAQVMDQPGVYILNGELADRVPRTHHDWRDTRLLCTSAPFFNDGMEVRSSGRGFALMLDLTTNAVILTKPTVARADPAKFAALARKVQEAQVLQFVTDSPRVDLDAFGLQPPELELALLKGTNEQFVVQFGKSPETNASVVYARRMLQTNIVLVPRSLLEALQISHGDLRDRHLVNWSTNVIDSIEVIGSENFIVRRQTNGTWTLGDSAATLADPQALREWMDALSRLEGVVEKDVVTDFARPYGLSPPARRYVLRTTVTNLSGISSNRIVAELHLGSGQDGKFFARRPDEATVYSLSAKDVSRLPRAAWQLRDRRVWNFTTNQVQSVAVRYQGRSYSVLRKADGSWSGGNMGALEELMFQLGNLRASLWVDEGEASRERFGFTNGNDRIAIDLKGGDKPQTLALEFGGKSPNILPYALTAVEGQTFVLELPATNQINIINVLFKPLFQVQ